ncbi:Oidioi.mRNA.OKI2018_I69.PAR.g10214.t3.cds [Oikopleura dioica]|uniref:Oidioi.mRNA.OKI2018_I69.PAR.g10214.t3.cds n=1 Tax=Oikopleura dioica TaxID=34765 RepID=A0ABN7RTW6_OIKDI|nr:Oidioi.mRNA.OKI2018_I69.PAR.g10214.t3.cds [Oikopleura dioica]
MPDTDDAFSDSDQSFSARSKSRSPTRSPSYSKSSRRATEQYSDYSDTDVSKTRSPSPYTTDDETRAPSIEPSFAPSIKRKSNQSSSIKRSSHSNAPAEANRSHLTSAAKSNVGKHKKGKKASNTSLNNSNYTKLDPVTARILSAQKKKRNQTQNEAGQIRIRNQQLEYELKSLRIQCIRQEKALAGFENTQSALPQVLQQYEDDKRVLKDRLRKAKESERRLERDKKRLEDDKHRQDRKIKDLKQKVKAGHLDERFELQQKLTEAEQAAEQALIELEEAKKNARLQLQALERELKKETRRRVKAESSAQASTDEVDRLRSTIKEKERQLGVLNIYSQKRKAKSHNTSLALEPSASPRPYSKREERPVPAFTTPLPAASSPRPQSQPKVFMTEPEETKISLPVAKPEPVVEQREPTPEPSPLPPSPAPAPTNEEKTNDILDDLLGLNTKKEKDPSPLPPASPQLLDLPVAKEEKKTIPNFFDDEPDEKKDDILADLRDLHAQAPAKEPEEKKNNILNIFDDAPEPKIDPKEKKQQSVLDDIFGDTQKEKEVDDLDAFLGIKQEKKSQRKEYNFTPSVNNLHEGKAANGYEPAPKKKENLIDNLFGTTDFDEDLEYVY